MDVQVNSYEDICGSPDAVPDQVIQPWSYSAVRFKHCIQASPKNADSVFPRANRKPRERERGQVPGKRFKPGPEYLGYAPMFIEPFAGVHEPVHCITTGSASGLNGLLRTARENM